MSETRKEQQLENELRRVTNEVFGGVQPIGVDALAMLDDLRVRVLQERERWPLVGEFVGHNGRSKTRLSDGNGPWLGEKVAAELLLDEQNGDRYQYVTIARDGMTVTWRHNNA